MCAHRPDTIAGDRPPPRKFELVTLPQKATNEPRKESALQLEPGSYRDRQATVFYHEGKVLRALSATASANWEQLRSAPFFAEMMALGRIVRTARAERVLQALPAGAWVDVVEHARIPFVSYPYEWTFGMLKDAALLHLELLEAALGASMILKDASAYNMQWTGVQPVFVDIPSFEPLRRGEPWVGYRQFCELFLYPLMLRAYKGVDFRPWLRGNIDGVPAHALRPLLSLRDLARPGVLMHVVAQNALQRRFSDSPRNVRNSIAEAGFDERLIVRNIGGLKAIIRRMKASGAETTWADYANTHSYGEAEFQAKLGFVQEAAALRQWRLVWDLGCNAGIFSRAVAEHADYVVAMDGDWMAVERLYQDQQARADRQKILPLVVNLADPSPNQGWQGLERKALPDRGKPELTLCLALIHHIAIGANIPIGSFLGWLASLGTALVIEFVGRDDEMVETLLRNKDDQHPDYNLDHFEAELSRRFVVHRKQPLKGGKRWIYFAMPIDDCRDASRLTARRSLSSADSDLRCPTSEAAVQSVRGSRKRPFFGRHRAARLRGLFLRRPIPKMLS